MHSIHSKRVTTPTSTAILQFCHPLPNFELTAIGCILDLISEPLYALSTRRLDFHIDIWREALGSLTHSVLRLLMIRRGAHPAMVFAAGHVGYGACAVLVQICWAM